MYSYTAENRLATGPGGAVLFYDPTGRLSRLTKGTSTTRFDHLGPRLVIERDAAGTILRRYVHGPGDDEPLVWYEGATLSDKRWLHTDERGSVVAISDASVASIATNRYDEYGIPQGSNAGRFQYTGQAWVAELGLYYYKARFYSPTLGRFLQTDPIGYEDQVNLYAYVGGDPINRLDPTGTSDLELFPLGDDLALAGTLFEINNRVPAVFTITGHASPKGFLDDRMDGTHKFMSPSALVNLAKQNGYNPSQILFLGGCNLAVGSYASDVARSAQGSVIAANGYVMYPKGIPLSRDARAVNLRVNASQDGKGEARQFIQYDKNGNPTRTFDTARYDVNSGKLTFRGESKLGTRTGTSTTVCGDKNKCDSK